MNETTLLRIAVALERIADALEEQECPRRQKFPLDMYEQSGVIDRKLPDLESLQKAGPKKQ